MKPKLLIMLFILAFKTHSFGQKPKIEIYINNLKELLTFQQLEHDISGETAVRVKVTEAVKGQVQSFKWSTKDDKIKVFESYKDHAIIRSIKPGFTNLYYEVFDKNKSSLGKVTYPIFSPKFIRILEDNEYGVVKNAIPKGVDIKKATQFDEVLKYSRLLKYKKEIYANARKVVNGQFPDINIRVVWEDFGEKVPIFVDQNYVVVAGIGGFARDYELSNKSKSHNKSIGLTIKKLDNYQQDSIFVTIGRIADRYTMFNLETEGSSEMLCYRKIIDFFKDKTITESRKKIVIPAWKDIFSKIFGFTISHEIGHAILPFHWGNSEGHTIKELPEDMMSAGFDDLDIGIIVKDWSKFPLPGFYKWGPMKGFNNVTMITLQGMYMAESHPRFKKFQSIN